MEHEEFWDEWWAHNKRHQKPPEWDGIIDNFMLERGYPHLNNTTTLLGVPPELRADLLALKKLTWPAK